MRQEEKSERLEAHRRAKILVVEDEPAMVAGLRDNFEFEGYEVITARDGVEGLQRALDESPDLVVLDVMMPRMSGLEVCKQLRAKRASLPIIMLTARGQEVDKVVGLELGADDYVTKPFSIRELLARVKSVLRRTAVLPKDKEQHSFADVEVDLRRCRVLRSGKALDISVQGIRLAEIFHLSSRRNAEPRSSAGGCVGLRELLQPPGRWIPTWCVFAKSWSPIRNNHSTFSPCTEPATGSSDRTNQTKSQ